MTIKATEFGFIMPDTIPAGVTTLHIENVGGMPHFLEFQSVASPKTDADIQAFITDPANKHAPPPSWVSPADFPNIGLLSSGTSTDVTMDIPAGRYGVFCWMPDANGTPHAILGMHHVFTVTGTPDAGVTLPQSDVTLTATDGSPQVPDSIPVGAATLGFANSGTKKGQVSIARILVDAPIAQVQKMVNAWFGSGYEGTPPVEFLGGLNALPPSTTPVGTSTVDFVDGVYAFIGPGKAAPVIRTVGTGAYPAVASPTPSGPDACGAATANPQVTAGGIAFNTACIAVPANTAFPLMFDNEDPDVPHNVSILKDAKSPALFTGDLVIGTNMTTYNVDALPAGTYIFRCDVHPATMTGTLVVG